MAAAPARLKYWLRTLGFMAWGAFYGAQIGLIFALLLKFLLGNWTWILIPLVMIPWAIAGARLKERIVPDIDFTNRS